MKQIAAGICLAVCLSSGVAAEENDNGLSLMEQGVQLFMEGILKEMEPAIDGFSDLADQMEPALRSFAEEMGPRLSELLGTVEDWSAYDAPEILPNGDIIIRRKPEHPMVPPDSPTVPAPQIEL